jgi:hypothetical protein
MCDERVIFQQLREEQTTIETPIHLVAVICDVELVLGRFSDRDKNRGRATPFRKESFPVCGFSEKVHDSICLVSVLGFSQFPFKVSKRARKRSNETMKELRWMTVESECECE